MEDMDFDDEYYPLEYGTEEYDDAMNGMSSGRRRPRQRRRQQVEQPPTEAEVFWFRLIVIILAVPFIIWLTITIFG